MHGRDGVHRSSQIILTSITLVMLYAHDSEAYHDQQWCILTLLKSQSTVEDPQIGRRLHHQVGGVYLFMPA